MLRLDLDDHNVLRPIGIGHCEVTGNGAVTIDGTNVRLLRTAARTAGHHCAARMKRATRRQRRWGRWLARNGIEPAPVRFESWRALQKRCRVGMEWTLEDVAHAARLDDAPAVHDSHAVGDFRHDTKIVRDKNGSSVRRGLPPRQQREHLCLHGDIERCRGFIGDDQFRPT